MAAAGCTAGNQAAPGRRKASSAFVRRELCPDIDALGEVRQFNLWLIIVRVSPSDLNRALFL